MPKEEGDDLRLFWPWWPRCCAEHPPLRVPAGRECRRFWSGGRVFEKGVFPEIGSGKVLGKVDFQGLEIGECEFLIPAGVFD